MFPQGGLGHSNARRLSGVSNWQLLLSEWTPFWKTSTIRSPPGLLKFSPTVSTGRVKRRKLCLYSPRPRKSNQTSPLLQRAPPLRTLPLLLLPSITERFTLAEDRQIMTIPGTQSIGSSPPMICSLEELRPDIKLCRSSIWKSDKHPNLESCLGEDLHKSLALGLTPNLLSQWNCHLPTERVTIMRRWQWRKRFRARSKDKEPPLISFRWDQQ